MTDYRHEILFGSFLTPSTQRPEQVVALARLAERAGLDLATIQDHPYQPGFLDTWTLLSYVAAVTSRIRLAGNVINLPLRQPVVLARSVASLDLLTAGRTELGLGAGAFWDAIEANGGRRLRPGQAVAALGEAIRIIREVWAADQRGGVRVTGEYYRVVGAKRGPAPAHEISIWVGGYRPRMLRLIGQVANGWLPSLPYLSKGVDSLAEGNARIDEAAVAAGRNPGSVRRLLNIAGSFATGSDGLSGPPPRWVDELTSLAVNHGISGFILMSDDPSTIQRFAEEVAPAVREQVAAERARPPAQPGPVHVPREANSNSVAADSDSLAQGSDSGAASDPATTASGSPGSGGLVVKPTPPPAVRLSKRIVWDESTRPVGPPAPPKYVYSPRAQALGQHLVDIHDHLRQELAQIRDLVQQVTSGVMSVGGARSVLHHMTMRQHNWTLGAYCAAYCRLLTQHHQLEDSAVFPHLRRSDSGLAAVIDRLVDEHVIIHEIVDNVDRALVRLVSHPDDTSELREAVDLLTDALLSHLSYEEQQLIEPIARYGFYAGQI